MLPSLAGLGVHVPEGSVGGKKRGGKGGRSSDSATVPRPAHTTATSVQVRDTSTSGKGLFALRPFMKNETIFVEEIFAAAVQFKLDGRLWPNEEHQHISMAWGLVARWLVLERDGGVDIPPWISGLASNQAFVKAQLDSDSDKHVLLLLMRLFPRGDVLGKFSIAVTNYYSIPLVPPNIPLSAVGEFSSRINHRTDANVTSVTVMPQAGDQSYTILWRALVDINIGDELYLDYGPEYAAFF